MPSSTAATPEAGLFRRSYDLVRSQGFGIACGLLTTLLLAVGTLVMAFTADGASSGVAMDDLTAFFLPVSGWHLWLYLLMPVLGLFGLSTLLSTIESVADAWRAGRRTLSAYAPAVIHVAFLVTLCAHVVGGFRGQEDGVVTVGSDWTRLPDGRDIRAISLATDAYPDGSPLQVRAQVEIRDVGGEVSTESVGYNEPISSGWGADLLLLLRAAGEPTGALLTAGPAECLLAGPGDACTLAGRVIRLVRVQEGGHWGNTPVAFLQIEGAGAPEPFFLWPGGRRVLSENGASFQLAEIRSSPVVMLRSRHAPGNPFALVAAVLLGLGLLAMGRRWGLATR